MGDAPNEKTTAEKLTSAVGSWKFINYQTGAIIAWVFFNSFLCFWVGAKPYDPFPYVLLNLFFSTQAAYTGPIVLMAQSVQTKRDKVRDEKMDNVALKTEKNTEAILLLAEDARRRDEQIEMALRLLTEATGAQTTVINRMAENQVEIMERWREEVEGSTDPQRNARNSATKRGG